MSKKFSDSQLTESSKLLSYILRHGPSSIGLQLNTSGWAKTEDLLTKLNAMGHQFSTELLNEIVAQNSKQRFAFSADKQQIRANQGHSVEVNLDLPEKQPPDILFHGTAQRFSDAIRAEGLKPGQRHDVHLSADSNTAHTVGSRHGSPIVLAINAKQMYNDGFKFYLSENSVWLTGHVPSKYIK